MTLLRACVVALFVALVALSTEIWLYARNTLFRNQDWISSKVLLELTPTGAHYFVRTRNALQGNRLRLDSWHGYQELHYRSPVEPGRIELSFEISFGAYLCVLFNRDRDGYDGLRLSRDSDHPSQVFHADALGRFVTRTPLEGLSIRKGWHLLALDFDDRGVRAALDGEEVPLPPMTVVRPQWFGVRNAAHLTNVDDVCVTDRSGAVVVAESFRNTRGYWRVAGIAALGWALALGALWRFGRRGRFATFRVLLATCVLLVCGSMYLAFDVCVWTRSYPYEEHAPGGGRQAALLVQAEHLRRRLAGESSEQWVPRELLRELEIAPVITSRDWNAYPAPYGKLAHHYYGPGRRPNLFRREEVGRFAGTGADRLRVVFVGGSQTYGEGADAIENSSVSRMHARFAERFVDPPVETFNLAIRAGESPELLELFESEWLALGPDVVVVCLSFNDPDADVLIANLRRFVELSRGAGAEIVLVIEPTTLPANQKHTRMLELGGELGVLVLDLRAHMCSDGVRDRGFVWWDLVHPTSLGHLEIADWLGPRLERVLERVRDR